MDNTEIPAETPAVTPAVTPTVTPAVTPTVTPAEDNEAGEVAIMAADRSPLDPTVVASAIESRANTKETKASTCERISIGVLLTVVITFAIIVVVLTIRTIRPMNQKKDYGPGNIYDGERITEDPFEVDDSLFSSNATEPYYASIEELRNDIEGLAKTFANTLILKEGNVDDIFVYQIDDDLFSFRRVDDYGSYNYEEKPGVKMAVNGAHVFTAVYNQIEVWDLEGSLLETSTISGVGELRYWAVERFEDVPFMSQIHALLMNPEGNRLTAIFTDGYNMSFEYDMIIEYPYEIEVVIFDIEGSSLTEISRTSIDGNYVDSYSVGNNVHVVTTLNLNMNLLSIDLLRYNNNYDFSSNQEYVAAATLRAEELIPEFVDRMIKELLTEDDEILLSRLVGVPELVNVHIKSITQVTSFDTEKIGDEYQDGIESHTSKSMVLQPGTTTNGYVYATGGWIWVLTEVANERCGPDDQDDVVEQTLFLGFRLDGASSRFAAAGTTEQSLSEVLIDLENDEDEELIFRLYDLVLLN